MTRNNMVVQYYLFALWKYQNEPEGMELCSTHHGGIDRIAGFPATKPTFDPVGIRI